MPDLSIIVTAYNYAQYLRECVESVVRQIDSGDEFIVIDDGSTDNTGELLAPYAADKVLTYVRQDNAGVAVARNNGVEQANNNFIVFLDADDIMLDGALDAFRAGMEAHPECDMLCAGRQTVDAAGKIKHYPPPTLTGDGEKDFFNLVLSRRLTLSNGAICMRKDMLLKHRYPEHLRVREDYCLYARLLTQYRACAIAGETVRVRKHQGSLRHEIDHILQVNERITATMFDEAHIPESLQRYRQRFHCQQMLSVFRALYTTGRHADAKQMYARAIRCRPLNLLQFSYLRKYLRLLLSR